MYRRSIKLRRGLGGRIWTQGSSAVWFWLTPVQDNSPNLKIFALRFGHEHIVTSLHRLTCCTSLHRLTCCTSLYRLTCLHRTATRTATDMLAFHSQPSDVQMLYAQNSCSNLASSGAWLFLIWSAQGPDLLQVQEDDQSSFPMPQVASLDTVPVTCCVPLLVLHSMEFLSNRVSHTQKVIKAKTKLHNEFCIWVISRRIHRSAR